MRRRLWRRPPTMKRLAVAGAVPVLIILLALPRPARAGTFNQLLITSLNCSSTPGVIQVVNSAPDNTPLDFVAIELIPAGGGSPTIIPLDSQNLNASTGAIQPAASYSVAGGGTLNLQVGPGASQIP